MATLLNEIPAEDASFSASGLPWSADELTRDPLSEQVARARVPDLHVARQFLHALDPNARYFTFQTVDDDKQRKDQDLTHIMHGGLDQVAQRLMELNSRGAGIFVTINATDFKGRKVENIARVRAVWQDDDSGWRGQFPLPPSAEIATSPGKFQRYWFLAEGDSFGPIEHRGVMKRMISAYGSDPNTKDLARVLRLPGFYHCKGKSFPVHIVTMRGSHHLGAAILSAFPPIPDEERTSASIRDRAEISAPQRAGGRTNWAEVVEALRFVSATERDTWLKIGMALHHHSGGTPIGFATWRDWSLTSPTRYEEQDQQRTWLSFKESGVTIRTLFELARQGGADLRTLARENDSRGMRCTVGAGQPPEPVAASGTEMEIAPWPVLSSTAAWGIAGEIASLATRNSEADPVAVLLTTLVWAGAAFGRKRYLRIGDTKHHTRLFAAIVGESSRARKGKSVEPVRRIFDSAEQHLTSHSKGPLQFPSGLRLNVVPGPLSSGEGLIHAVRDPSAEPDQGGNPKDPGIIDKRLLCIEGEFSAVLRAFQRQGNTLSVILRSAWDGVTLSPLTKHFRESATDPHVCILGHITRQELKALLASPDVWNGFANRFLWSAVRRPKLVPFPEPMPAPEVESLARELAGLIAYSHGRDDAPSEIVLTNSAMELWCTLYPELTVDHPGLLGAVTSRAEAQVVRLALTYATLDGHDKVGIEHIEAAMAMWRYAFDSARLIFGPHEFKPHAQKVMDALSKGPMTQTEISNLFGRNLKAQELKEILIDLQARNRIGQRVGKDGRGRPSTVWSRCDG